MHPNARFGFNEEADIIQSTNDKAKYLVLRDLPITLDEIAANDHDLNIPRYVEQKVLTVEEAMRRLRESAEAAFAAEEMLIFILKRERILL